MKDKKADYQTPLCCGASLLFFGILQLSDNFRDMTSTIIFITGGIAMWIFSFTVYIKSNQYK